MKMIKMVTLEEKKYNASIDCMCSWCGAFADIVIPNKVKLCSKCYGFHKSQSLAFGEKLDTQSANRCEMGIFHIARDNV